MKYTLYSLLALMLLAGCKKNEFATTQRDSPDGKALVKVAVFSTTNTTVNLLISVNEQRVSTVVPNFNAAYPGGGLNTSGSSNSDYLALEPGVSNVSLDVVNTGTPNIVSNYFKGTASFEANKRYMYAVVDTGADTKDFYFNVDTETPDSGFVKFIFGHGIPNAPAVDMYKGPNAANSTLLLSNIAYLGHSEWVTIPAGTDSLFLRTAGSPNTSTPIARRGFTYPNQRIVTVLSRGYAGITSGNRTATLALFYNQ